MPTTSPNSNFTLCKRQKLILEVLDRKELTRLQIAEELEKAGDKLWWGLFLFLEKIQNLPDLHKTLLQDAIIFHLDLLGKEKLIEWRFGQKWIEQRIQIVDCNPADADSELIEFLDMLKDPEIIDFYKSAEIHKGQKKEIIWESERSDRIIVKILHYSKNRYYKLTKSGMRMRNRIASKYPADAITTA